MKVVYSEHEKRAVLTALKSKGFRRPPNWKLIHKQECSEDELNFDHSKLLDRLSEQFRLENSDYKFAIDVVSNPDERSASDKGVLKVRFRYVLSAAHQGESKIKSNSREFCIALINQDKLYRIEDINIMSFRGVNPIARKNYSIFRLRGHWNCRHTWQREVYLVERDNENVENNELISKSLEMAKETGIVKKFKDLISTNKEKITMSEAVEIAKELMNGAEFAFKDIAVGDKTLRIEGEEITEGAVVAWVDSEGKLVSVEEPEVIIENDGKKILLVIKDSKISEVKEPEVEEETEEMEDKGALKEGDEVKLPDGKTYVVKEGKLVEKTEEEMKETFADKRVKELEKEISDLKKGQKEGFESITKKISEEFAKIPAVQGHNPKQGFSEKGDGSNRFSVLSEKPLN